MSREHENQQPDELKSIEQSLAALAPAPARLDRDRLMFLAGQASMTASGRCEPPDGVAPADTRTIGKLTHPARLVWPATSAALAATSLALAIALLTRPAPQTQIVYLDREVPVVAPADVPREVQPVEVAREMTASATPSAPATRAANNYLHTRDVALRFGVDALGNRQGATDADPVKTYGDWLESVLPSPAVSRPSSSPFPSM